MRKLAVITGDAGLLGISLVQVFKEQQFDVVGVSRTSHAHLTYPRLVRDIGKNTKEIVAELVKLHGVPDVFISNACATPQGLISETSDEEMESTFRTNVFAPLILLRSLASVYKTEGLIKNTLRNRSIIVVSSASMRADVLLRDSRPLSLYAASKSAVASIALGASKEFLEFGVRVNVIAPSSFTGNLKKTRDIAHQCFQLAENRTHGEVVV